MSALGLQSVPAFGHVQREPTLNPKKNLTRLLPRGNRQQAFNLHGPDVEGDLLAFRRGGFDV